MYDEWGVEKEETSEENIYVLLVVLPLNFMWVHSNKDISYKLDTLNSLNIQKCMCI